MNSKERVQTTLSHQEPDRVPMMMSAGAWVVKKLKQHLGVQTDRELHRALHLDIFDMRGIDYKGAVGARYVGPENLGIPANWNGDFTKLTEDEKFHFGCIHYNHFSVAEIMYLQAKRGLVHPESIARAMKTCYFYWSQPGFNDFWNSQLKFYLSSEFVEAIESGRLMGDRNTLPTDMGAGYFAQRPTGD